MIDTCGSQGANELDATCASYRLVAVRRMKTSHEYRCVYTINCVSMYHLSYDLRNVMYAYLANYNVNVSSSQSEVLSESTENKCPSNSGVCWVVPLSSDSHHRDSKSLHVSLSLGRGTTQVLVNHKIIYQIGATATRVSLPQAFGW